MATIYSPKIVTDSLVLCLDAANPKSYPGSGTTWSDLSKNGNDGTLVNGPTYSSDNNGSLSFDGTNDHARLGTNSTYQLETSNFTISAWVKINSTQPTGATYHPIITNKNAPSAAAGFGLYWNNSQNKFLFSTANGSSASEKFSQNQWNVTVNDKWANVIMVRQNGVTNNGHFYINGIYESLQSSATVLNVNSATELTIGNTSNLYSPYWMAMSLGVLSLYNRALSADEIKQNFTATRGRYGI